MAVPLTARALLRQTPRPRAVCRHHRTLSLTAYRCQQHERPLVSPTSIAPAPASPTIDPALVGTSATGLGVKPRASRFQRFRTAFGRWTLFVVVGGTAGVFYVAYQNRHPPDQLPPDPNLPTLVVLGNGWGATSFLKNLDTDGWNVAVVSPRNYFTFTPLLPSVTVGTLDSRSVIQPTRFITRHKKRAVEFYEAEAEEVDPATQTITFVDTSPIKGDSNRTTIHYDKLVYAVGSENQTFGIEGVRENACFLKEITDAEKIRTRLMDCIESATFKGQSASERERLLHMVVVGGGPTGIEYAGELHDFVANDLAQWYPDIVGNVKITLIEALPKVLPMFSQQLIDYTTATFRSNHIDVMTRTMVKRVGERTISAQAPDGKLIDIPYGLLVWATGNTSRSITRKLQNSLGDAQKDKRGLTVNDHLLVDGTDNIWAMGDCTATQYAPTAQAASQQGQYLARIFNQMTKQHVAENALEQAQSQGAPAESLSRLAKRVERASSFRPFHYSHQGSLAYIGSEKAIADLPFFNGNFSSGGFMTMVFWRSAYLSTLFSLRNRSLVLADWLKVRGVLEARVACLKRS